MARNSRIVRTWIIWSMLASGYKTLGEIANAVTCAERTVRRDIEALEAAGVSVLDELCSDGRRRWRTLSTRVPERAE